MSALSKIVKTYDVRGLVGSEITAEVCFALGASFAKEMMQQTIIIGHDMRSSSPELASSFSDGIRAVGKNVLFLGLCSTDQTYFVSGFRNLPAAMFTASHNPASYNGIKFSRAGAKGISMDTGLSAIRDGAADILENPDGLVGKGSIEVYDSLSAYASHLHSLVAMPDTRVKIAVDAANGMAGLTVPAVLAGFDLVEMYFELDGSFPNHEANPLDPKNLIDLQKRVVESGAALGLAFDGDADRCFVVDELGNAVNPSAIAAIVAEAEIRRVSATEEPIVIHNLLTSRHVKDTVESLGATALKTKVGHSLIKDVMASSNAVFGAEHSAHYYFRDFYGADNGMLAAMHLIARLAATGKTMSQLASENTPYFLSGEINSVVQDAAAVSLRVRNEFSEAEVEEFDGLSLSFESETDWWWLNLRTSNTEPLLRLNVEAVNKSTMETIRDRALSQIVL